jgi:glycosyltransferase involved in cell wall biosynthesis
MNYLSGIAMRKARQIVTVSEFSRRELTRFYDIDPNKVIAIPNGVSQRFQPLTNSSELPAEQAVLARYGIVKPYIFAVGNIHPRKNLGRLLEAYLSLKKSRELTPKMVWGGLQRWESGTLIQRAQSAEVILPGFIAQEDLPTLYRQAEMLVYPSLYEGFGLPPAEAMACGTPVIASNTSSLPEVIGDAGIMVDPTNVEAIAKAMDQLLDDAALRNRLKQVGIERASKFTWEQTAQCLLKALEGQK